MLIMYRATKVTVISFKNKRNDEFVYMFAHDTYQAKRDVPTIYIIVK